MPEETILTPTETNQETPEAEVTPEVTPESNEEKTLVESEIEDSGEKKADVPEKYEIKLGEGQELDQGLLDAFTPIFKELGLSQEAVQKLAETYVPLVNDTAEKVRQESMNAYKQLVEGWKSETMKELGANSKQELSYCGKAIQKFGDNKLREALQETGMGNHPALVNFMRKVGKTISEDTFVDGNSAARQDPLNIMYPSMKQ